MAVWAGCVWAQKPHVYPVQGAVAFTHDPSIAKDGNTYYVFATGRAPGGGQFPIRCSEDLTHWRMCGQVFDAIPEWIQQRSRARATCGLRIFLTRTENSGCIRWPRG